MIINTSSCLMCSVNKVVSQAAKSQQPGLL